MLACSHGHLVGEGCRKGLHSEAFRVNLKRVACFLRGVVTHALYPAHLIHVVLDIASDPR